MGNPTITRKPRNWKTPAIVVLAGVFLLLTFLWIFDSFGASALNRAVQQAQAIGGPLTMDELYTARPKWSGEKNGADVILGVKPNLDQAAAKPDWAKAVPLFDTDLRSIELGRQWSPAVQKRVEDFLAGYSKELAAIDTLKEYDGGGFPIQVAKNPMDTPLPHLTTVRTCSRLKRLDVTLRAMRGECDRLSADFDTLLTHSRLLANEPTIISALVARACDAQALRALETVLALTQARPQELKRVQDLLVDRDTEAAMKQGIRGERAFFIAACDYLRNTKDFSALGGYGLSGLAQVSRIPGAQGWIMKSEAHGITFYNRMLQARGALGVYQEAQAVENEVSKSGRLDVMTRVLFPSLSRALAVQLEWCAEIRTARLAVAAERYRLAAGEWPTQLGQLVPQYIDAIPEDPFNPGHPLRMAREKDRLLIYSIGRNMEDDKGRLLRGNRESDSPDCGFILLDPAARNQPPLPDSKPADAAVSQPS